MKEANPYERLKAGDLVVFARTFGAYAENYETLGIIRPGDVGLVLRDSDGETLFVLTRVGPGYVYRTRDEHMKHSF